MLKPATLVKVTLLHGCFSRFLNCTNGTKSRKESTYLINVSHKCRVLWIDCCLSVCPSVHMSDGSFLWQVLISFFLIFCMMVDKSPIFRENSPNIKVFKVFTKVLSLHFSGFGGKWMSMFLALDLHKSYICENSGSCVMS